MPYWSVEEERQLVDMVETGMPLKDICEVFHRSPEAVKLKIRRLGLKSVAHASEGSKLLSTTTTGLPEIKPKQLLTMEEMLKLLMGAVELLRQPGISGLELKRCRTIVSMARSYLSMLQIYEHVVDLEQRIVDNEARLIEIYKDRLRKTDDAEEQERIKQNIKLIEESAWKEYKPFKPKPSLIG